MSNAERFAKYVDKSECWLWKGGVLENGYGIFHWVEGGKGKSRSAHRCAYELAYGPIAEGMMVLHTCDNRTCVRPDHLYLGTHEQNMRDMKERNRAATGEHNGKQLYPERIARGDAHWTHQHPEWLARGEHGNSKYTADTVAEMRKRREAGALLREIAAEFGIPIATVHQICSRSTWRD
jgi:hypothetical protein